MQLVKLTSHKPARIVTAILMLASMVIGATNLSATVSAADSCGYTFTGAGYNNFGGTSFNESTVLKAISLQDTTGVGLTVAAWYADEHPMVLGARRVVTGTTGVDYQVNQAGSTDDNTLNNTSHAIDPATGATPQQGGMDAAGRPMGPSLFVTKVASSSVLANVPQPGDWQSNSVTTSKTSPAAAGAKQGGQNPDDVFGSWKSGVMTRNADGTYKSYLNDADMFTKPAAGQWSFVTTAGSTDAVPADGTNGPATGAKIESFTVLSTKTEEYVNESRWNVSALKDETGAALAPGNSYKVQVLVNDGDNAGDKGEGCAIVTIPQAGVSTKPGGLIANIIQVEGCAQGDITSPGNACTRSDVATVTGNKGTPTGTVDFRLWFYAQPFAPGANDCQPGAANGEITLGPSFVGVALNASGVATSPQYDYSQLGIYAWIAKYNGDSTYAASTEICGKETVATETAVLDLTPLNAVNPLTQNHKVTAQLRVNDGVSLAAAGGKLVTFTLSPTPNSAGAFFATSLTNNAAGPSSCTTDASGNCDIFLHAVTPGSVTIHASSSFGVAGVGGTFSAATNTPGHPDANKTWVSPTTTMTVTDHLVGLGNLNGTASFEVYNNANCTPGFNPVTGAPNVIQSASGITVTGGVVSQNPASQDVASGQSLSYHWTFTPAGSTTAIDAGCKESVVNQL